MSDKIEYIEQSNVAHCEDDHMNSSLAPSIGDMCIEYDPSVIHRFAQKLYNSGVLDYCRECSYWLDSWCR